MFKKVKAKVKAWWAECGRRSELRLIRKHYFRKTGVSIDHYSDEEMEEVIKIGKILKKHKVSADDAIKYLTTITAMDMERGKGTEPMSFDDIWEHIYPMYSKEDELTLKELGKAIHDSTLEQDKIRRGE